MKGRAESDLQALRDKAFVTRLMVLRELQTAPGTTLSAIAGRLGVTVQAISVHVRSLEREGFLESRKARAGHTLTPAGLQFLHEGLSRLKRTVDEALAPLVRVEVTSAVAATPVRAGERVGLFMEEGDLVARARATSPSTGIAVEGALPGEELIVRDLAGFVDLKPARLWVLRVPAPAEGGARLVNARRLRAHLKEREVEWRRAGAIGAGAKVLARRLEIPIHFEFAATDAAFNAAELGVPTLLLVQRDRLADALAAIDERNRATLSRVTVELVEDPEADARGAKGGRA